MRRLGLNLQNKYVKSYCTYGGMSNDKDKIKIEIFRIKLIVGLFVLGYISSYPLLYIKERYDRDVIKKYNRQLQKKDWDERKKRMAEKEHFKSFIDDEVSKIEKIEAVKN